MGRRPEIVVRGDAPGPEIDAVVFFEADYEADGPWRAQPAARVKLCDDGSGELTGTTDRPLSEGRWTLCVRDHVRRRVLCSAVMRVAADVEAWGSLFERMLVNRLERLGSSPYLVPSEEDSGAPFFSLITQMRDVSARDVEELARSVLSQSFAAFEWLILDDGATCRETYATLEGVAESDARVRMLRRVDRLQVVAGHRLLLENARGRVVISVDDHCFLYPDALERFADTLFQRPDIGLVFSDTQRVSPLGSPISLTWSPEWSTVHALAAVPANCFMAYRRGLALEAGVYTGDYAGDRLAWDTILRLVDAGAKAMRVEEVLCGRRAQSGLLPMSHEEQAYVEVSDRAVLGESLRRRGLDDRFALDSTAEEVGYYHCVRRATNPPELALDFVVRMRPGYEENLRHNVRILSYPNLRVRILVIDGPPIDVTSPLTLEQVHSVDLGRLGAVASQVPEGCFAKAIVDCGIRLIDSDWTWDAVGTLELDPGAGLVTGPILDRHGCIASAGYVAGLDGFFGIPRMRQALESVPLRLGQVRHAIMAAYSGFLVLRAGVPHRCGPLLSVDADDAVYGIEYALRCREQGVTTAYTPRMRGERDVPFTYPVGTSDDALREQIAQRHGAQIVADPYYSRYLSKNSIHYGKLNFCCAA